MDISVSNPSRMCYSKGGGDYFTHMMVEKTNLDYDIKGPPQAIGHFWIIKRISYQYHISSALKEEGLMELRQNMIRKDILMTPHQSL